MKKTQFKKFVARYKDLIYSHAYYFMGNKDDAADITQEILLKLWHHLDKIAPGAIILQLKFLYFWQDILNTKTLREHKEGQR